MRCFSMNTNNNTTNIQGPFYMPDSSPAPYIMTEEEAIKFLRIDTNNTQHPEMTIQHYINEGLLIPVTIGKCRKFPLPELIKFVERLSDKKQGNIS